MITSLAIEFYDTKLARVSLHQLTTIGADALDTRGIGRIDNVPRSELFKAILDQIHRLFSRHIWSIPSI